MNAGDTVSRYRILGRLGQGGMGVVYQAEDTRLNRTVALKFLPPDALSEHDRLRFLNEAQAAAAIGHPNICAIYDVEEVGGQIFIAMAYIAGMPLSKKMAPGPLDIREAARLGAQIASGLAAAHRVGIIHRDIKAANIVVTEDGHACILDFGLALRSGVTRLTQAGGTVGTPSYMSPEQALGKDVDFRTDIWSLGVLLFEMVTGVLPFRRDHQSAIIHAIVNDPAPPVASLRPAAPPELRRVIDRALCKDPAERWDSAREMADELRKIAGDSPSVIEADPDLTRTIVLDAAPSEPKRQSRKLALGFLVVALLAGGFFLARYPRGTGTVREATPVDERHVAVLPFDVPKDDAELAAVADGMAEVLTGALSDTALFHGRVTAVPSSEIRRTAIDSAQKARRVYGVNLAVSGSARRVGGAIEFTLKLQDAIKLRPIDSKVVTYDPNNPAEAKSAAVTELAHMLNFELTPIEKKAVTVGDSSAPDAYRAYLDGRGLLARYDVAGNIDKAITAFKKAIAEDPNYALAYTGLAEGYYWKLRGTHDEQFGRLALSNAEHAVKLDPTLGISHAVLGQVYATTGRQQEGIAHLKKAIEIAPNNAEAPRQLAQILADLGRLEEAEKSYIASTKARPTDWFGYLLLGIFYNRQQRWSEAENAYRKAQTLAPGNEVIYRNLGVLYAEQGRYPEAEKALQEGLRANPKSPSTFSTLASVLFVSHHFQEAVNAMEAAIELDPRKPYFWGNLGIYSKWAPGNEGKSAEALRKAVEMMEKGLEAIPDDFSSRANLAEYRARLGESDRALAELNKIPETARRPVATRFIIVYELVGRRAAAIAATKEYITTPEAMRQIRDDPDLARLWEDKAFQTAIPRRLLAFQH